MHSRNTSQGFIIIIEFTHLLIHGKIVAELIMDRSNLEKENKGLTTWRNAPKAKILRIEEDIYENFKERCAYVV